MKTYELRFNKKSQALGDLTIGIKAETDKEAILAVEELMTALVDGRYRLIVSTMTERIVEMP